MSNQTLTNLKEVTLNAQKSWGKESAVVAQTETVLLLLDSVDIVREIEKRTDNDDDSDCFFCMRNHGNNVGHEPHCLGKKAQGIIAQLRMMGVCLD